MANQITGVLKHVAPMETGVSKSSGDTWYKQLFVITTDGQYPKDVALTAWKDTAKAVSKLVVGTKLTVHFEPESREYNGKYYTDLKAFKYTIDGSAPESVDESTGEIHNAVPMNIAEPLQEGQEDDLPF